MQKLATVNDGVTSAPATRTISRARLAALYSSGLVLAAGGSLAGAQATPTGGTAAVQGLGLDSMISTATDGIRALITDNGGKLFIATLPVIGFFFIWNRLRSLV